MNRLRLLLCTTALLAVMGAAWGLSAAQASASDPLCPPFASGFIDGLVGQGRAARPAVSPGLAAGDAARPRPPRRDPDTRGFGDVPAPRAPHPGRPVLVPVYFHVIDRGPGIENGDLPQAMIAAQIRVLSETFAGARGGARSPFRFRLVAVTRTRNPAWFTLPLHDVAFVQGPMAALRRGGADALNIYTSQGDDTLLGTGSYPNEFRRDPVADGVTLHHGSLPGGSLEFFNLGMTASHEVGHWLGLLHTFEGGCHPNGDRFADTPPEAEPAIACPEGRDTCPRRPGLDPIHNYMDYTDDACLFEFTPGQVERMEGMHARFRAGR